MTRIQSFREFWPVYLRAHADPRCRAMHYLASMAGIAGVLSALATLSWVPLAAGLVVAYACAWIGHFFIEKNVPLTFTYPLWSFKADYLMFFRWLSGNLRQDLIAAGA